MIAMSGGVDSSVAAALTADLRGADVCAGVAMRLYSTADDAARTGRTCCAPDDLYDARRAAAKVGIHFYVYDAEERFRAQGIEPFIDSYALGALTKAQVRAIARQRGLPNADKAESMEVCFVGTTPLPEFLERHGVERARGEIVDVEGNVLGAHDGVHRFTVGQRRGIGSGFKLPLYVAALDARRPPGVGGSREEAQRRDLPA